MQQSTKENLANRNIWARGLYMLFYVIAYAVAEAIVALAAIFQFVHALVTGKVNQPLQAFSANLSAYILQILEYVTFNSEFQPFPFSDWPSVSPGETPWSEPASETNSDAAMSETTQLQATPAEVAATETAVSGAETSGSGDEPATPGR